MRYRLFGPTGLRVSELFLGAMTFGEQGGVGAPPEECARILDTYAERRTRQYGRSGREATWDRRREWAGPVLLGPSLLQCAGGAFRNISFPAAYLGLSSMSFALATRRATRPPTA